MYDFDSVINRRNTDSIKWNVKENELPMWVADMDFPAAPEIINALRDRLRFPVFGYGRPDDQWYDAYINWWKKYHGLEMKRQHLLFCSGVVPAISSIVRHLIEPGDKIVLLTPNYNHFYNCIRDNARLPLEVEMIFDGNRYSIDFYCLEKALSESSAKLMIICNPQNPTGTVWEKHELQKIGELCVKYDTLIVSDEIHCDIITPGMKYVPYSSVSELNRKNSITCIAPTKAFNLAGLHTSALYIPDDNLRKQTDAAINKDEIAMPNSFAAEAARAAFTKGRQWLDELNEYIYHNKQIVMKFLQTELPEIRLLWGDATYLLWLDCSALGMDSKMLSAQIRKCTGLYVMAGSYYGKGGEAFLRMNIACPQTLLLDGLLRLKKAVSVIKKID